MTPWTKVNDRLPSPGLPVLAWYGSPADYGIAAVDEQGEWRESVDGRTGAPTHWMLLPEPPGEPSETAQPESMKGKIVEGRMSLKMDEDRETVAALMQYYINGKSLAVEGEEYYVVEMKNEMTDGRVVTTFYFRLASE